MPRIARVVRRSDLSGPQARLVDTLLRADANAKARKAEKATPRAA